MTRLPSGSVLALLALLLTAACATNGPPPCDPSDPVCRWPVPNRGSGG